MPENNHLLPVTQIITSARKMSISLGKGDPINAIRYYIKIGLLPHMVRKKAVDNSPNTEGFLPTYTLYLLRAIDNYQKQGIKVSKQQVLISKMRHSLENSTQKVKTPPKKFISKPVLVAINLLFLALLIFGVANKTELGRKLSLSLQNWIDKNIVRLDLPQKISPQQRGVVSGEQTNLADKGYIFSATAENMLTDSSLEAQSLGSAGTVWRYIGDSASDNTTVSQEVTHSGGNALKFSKSGDLPKSSYFNLGVSQPIVQTVNGREYILSVWIKTKDVSADSYLRLGFFGQTSTNDPNYGLMTSNQWNDYAKDRFQDFPVTGNRVSGASEKSCNPVKSWCHLSFVISNAPLGKYPIIQVINYKSGAIYIDDVNFAETGNSYSLVMGEAAGDISATEVIMRNSFGNYQTNLKLGDGSILADSSGHIMPNSPYFNGSVGTNEKRFGGLYLTHGQINQDGDLTLDGDATLGNSTDDTLDVQSSIKSNLTPTTDVTYDLGSTAAQWRSLYAQNITLSGQLKLPDGTSSSPALIFSSDTNSGIYRIGADKIGIITGGSATQGLTIDSAGNIGIGTTAPSQKLDVQGAVYLAASSPSSTTYSLYNSSGTLYWNGLAVSGSGGVLPTGITGNTLRYDGANWVVSSLLYNDGTNVGIGTTSPLAKLHVLGECIVKGSLVRRRKKKRGDKDDEDSWEDVPVEDIQHGDEILSLNETTGKFEWQKVEETMDKGVQTVYELKTETGKAIETTANHPYYVKKADDKQLIDTNALYDLSFDLVHTVAKKFYFDILVKQTIIAPALDDAKVTISRSGWKHLHYEKVRSKLNMISRYAALPKIIPLLESKDANVNYRTKEDIEFWSFEGIVDDVLVKAVVRSIKNGEKHLYSVVWKGENKKDEESTKNGAVFRLYPRSRGLVTSQLHTDYTKFFGDLSSILLPGQKERAGVSAEDNSLSSPSMNSGLILSLSNVSSGGEWKKVSEISKGQLIATVDGFEKVVSIKKTGRKQTYDLQIANTHNFVAQKIVAHNTYLQGTSTANTAFSLRTADSAGADKFVVTNAGNVGIGTTSPSSVLDVIGNQELSGVLAVGGAAVNTARYINADISITPSATSYGGYFKLTSSNNESLRGLFSQALVNAAAGTTPTNYGVYARSTNNSTGTITSAYGVYGLTHNESTGTIVTATGFGGTAYNTAGGTITTAYGVISAVSNLGVGGSGVISTGSIYKAVASNAGGSSIGTIYGLDLSGWSNSGTIDNSYGIYMDTSIDVGTNKWALYSASASNSYFAGNVGIGNTSPATLLDVNGTAWIRGTAGGTGGLYVKSDGNVGVGTTSPSYLLSIKSTTSSNFISLDGTGQDFIDDTYNFRVTRTSSTSRLQIGTDTYPYALMIAESGGIGVGGSSAAAPAAALHVIGTDPIFRAERVASYVGYVDIGYNNGEYTTGIAGGVLRASKNLTLSATSGYNILFGNGSEKMRIDTSGNVGIGSTSPQAKLTINGTTEQLRLSYDTSNYQSFTVGSTGDLFIAQDGGAATLALTNGSVGIGTTAPTALLHLGIGSTATVGQKIVLASGATANAFEVNTSTGVGGDKFVIKADGNIGIGTTAPTGLLHVGIGATPAFVITSAGQVGIGTTSPGAALEINGNLLFSKETARTISVANSTTTNVAGANLSINGATGNGNGTGGAIDLTAGTGGGGGLGGAINITGGTSVQAGAAAGNVNITAGTGSNTGTAGNVVIKGGTRGAGSGARSGDVYIWGGQDGGAGYGGNVYLGKQDYSGSTIGGNVFIYGQNSSGWANPGDVGNIELLAGTQGYSAGTGGHIKLTSGRGGSAGDSGYMTLVTGAGGSTSGSSGALTLGTGAVTSGSFGTISLTQGANTRLFVDASGNVGIGTTSPTALLHLGIGSTATIGQKIVLASGATANAFEVNTSTGVGGDLVVMQSNGNVGIGTTNPVTFLDIVGDNANDDQILFSQRTTDDTAKFGVIAARQYDNGTEAENWSLVSYESVAAYNSVWFGGGNNNKNAATDIRFYTAANVTTHAGTEAMRIDNAGNVGIGTTGPAVALEIGGSGNVRIGGLTASLGVYTDASKNLTSTPPTSGVLGYWSRTGTTLSPSTGGDDIVLPTGDWIGLSSSTARLVFNDTTRDNLTITDGDLLFSADNTWDIGASGATRPRTGYFGTSVVVGSTITMSSSDINFSGNSTVTLGGDLKIGTDALYVSGTSGNVGVGTTSPTGVLHVVGQCVTGDTLLKRKRRRKGKNGEWIEDWEDVRIDEIQEGDEILTLNEETGQFVTSKVNGLMDMGVQDIYTLTTALGKTIRTTGNHPYLALSNSQSDQEFDSNIMFDAIFEKTRSLAKDFYFNILAQWDPFVPSLGDKVEISHTGWDHLHDKVRSKFDNMARYFALPKIIGILQSADIKPIYSIGKNTKIPMEFWSFLANVDGVLVKVVIRSVRKGQKHMYSVMWRGEVKDQQGNKKGAVSRMYKRTRGMITPQLQDLYYQFVQELSSQRKSPSFATGESRLGRDSSLATARPNIPLHLEDVKTSKWTKVKDLQEGIEIATIDGYEKIISIEKTKAEQVYDIEVADTHNFVGNGIVAHNTYLQGAGTTTGFSLRTADSAGADKFVIQDNGNVGIGTTGPGQKLDVNGSVNIGTNLLFTKETAHTIQISTTTSNASAPALNILGAQTDAYSNFNGGAVNITGGRSGTGSGSIGGAVTIQGGPGATSGGNALGGNLNLYGGTAYGNATGGNINIVTGTGGTVTGNSGALTLGTGTVTSGSFGVIDFKQGANYRVRIDTSGNVGIGTTSPTALLHLGIGSTATIGQKIVLASGATANAFEVNTSTGVGGDKFVIKADGNVGIGTTSPGAKLDVNGAINQHGAVAANVNAYLNVNKDNSASETLLMPGVLLYNNGVATYGLDIGFNGAYRTRLFTGSTTDISFAKINSAGSPTAQTDFTDLMVIKNSGNVGIGTTSPSALLAVGASSQFQVNSTGDITTSSTGELTIGGTGDSSIAGRLGIGVGAPATQLHVLATATSHGIKAQTGGTGYWAGLFYDNDASEAVNLASSDMALRVDTTGGVGTLSVTTTGNVGIGSTSPQAKLTINGTTEQLRLSYDTSNYQSFTVGSTGDLFIAQDGGAATLALTNGSVGIGTTSPGSKLHVVAGSNQYAGVFQSDQSTTTWTNTFAAFNMVNANATTYNHTLFTFSDAAGGSASAGVGIKFTDRTNHYGDLYFFTKGTDGYNQRVYIQSGGNVGIGTTSPASKLDVRDGRLSLTDADVAHGVTTWAPTNTYGQMEISHATNGGFDFLGISNNAGQFAMRTYGILTSSPTAGVPAVVIAGGKANGTGVQALGATDTVAEIRNTTTALMSILGSGNVGIGTTGPGYKVDITGTKNTTLLALSTTFTAANDYTNLDFISKTPSAADTVFGRVQGFADPAGGGYAGGLSFWTNPGGSAGTASTEKVRIQYNGNVGIGTTGPGALLDVADGSIRFSSTSNYSAVRDIGPIYFRSKDSEGTPFNVGSIRGYQSGSALGGIRGYYYSAGDQLGFELTTDSNFVVNTGNLGIGTTGPGAKLVVAASLGAGDYNWLTFRNLQSGYGTWGFVKKSNNDLAINYGVNSDTPTAGTSLYLQYGGNVGIGTTNPQRKLEVNGSIRMGALITGAGTAVAVYRDVNGDLADSTSSIRYKDEVIPYESVLDRVLSLQAVRFNWGQNTSTPGLGDFGMIAEQVNTYLPDLVTYEADGVTPHGLKYEKMGVFAIKAIQEQQVKLTALSIGITDKIDNISQLKEVEKSFTDKAATLSAKLASMESRLAFIEDNVLGASSSATLSGQLAQLNGLLATDKVATLSALTVTGRTNLNDLGVIGTISAGTLIIDGVDNSINSLTDTLKIQPSALAGVDFLGGKVTIDQKGDMKVAGKISAAEIETNRLSVEQGITLKDQTTGEDYCVMIKDGELQKAKGRCEEVSPTPTP